MSTAKAFTAIEARDIADGVNGSTIEALYDTYFDTIRRVENMPVSTPLARDAYYKADREISGMRAMLAGLGFTSEQLDVDSTDA